jgi:hypothetical protein
MSTAMDAASQLLGTSTTDLAAGLKSGQSLSDLASAKGVSKDDLVNAIAAALQKADSNLSADDAKTLATGLASRTAQANGTENQPWAAASQGDAGTMEILA